MLKTEVNTQMMKDRILFAAKDRFSGNDETVGYPFFLPSVFYEHGQWWVENTETGETWSVVDAEGGSSIDGFDFEPMQ
jgi:hypothetical protein